MHNIIPSEVWSKGNIVDRIKCDSNNAVDLLPLSVENKQQSLGVTPRTYILSHLISSLYSKICKREDAIAPGSSVPTTIMGGCTLRGKKKKEAMQV